MVRLQTIALTVGVTAAAAAVALRPHPAVQAAEQAGPAFLLVAGLLLIGAAAASEGIFEWSAERLTRLPLSNVALVAALLLLEAVVTAVLNLDTAIVFLTPVLLRALRHRRVAIESLLYGSLLMANAASLLLPGSNLTNVIVLRIQQVTGDAFMLRMLGPWCVSVGCCIVLLLLWRHRDFAGSAVHSDTSGPRLSPGPSMAGIALAAVLMVVLPDPAVAVLLLGVLVSAASMMCRRLDWRQLQAAIDWRLIAGLLGLSIAIGCLARLWSGPELLLAHASAPETALVAVIASVVLNNLPASLLLAAHPVPHWPALLLGLDLGPNLAITGSLAAFLWLGICHRLGERPRLRTLSCIGAIQLAISIALGLLLTR